MKFKIALTLMMIMLVSMISFSNRCGRTCDGQAYVSVAAPSVSKVADAGDMNAASDDEASSPLLRMAITL